MEEKAYQKNFQRLETKYLITQEQKGLIENRLAKYIIPDKYPKSLIFSMYFDTPSFLLTRRSMEKPTYKEKLRVRSYNVATADSPVFIEIKKKLKKICYKRRISLPENIAMDYLMQTKKLETHSQISKEIDYLLMHYENLTPKIFLSYERDAFVGVEDKRFRLTFDKNILWRDYDLDLKKGAYGENLLNDNQYIMEIKCENAVPLYFVKILSENKIYKTSFSKCAKAYMRKMMKNNKERKGEQFCA